MAITYWKPFNELSSMQRDLNRVFDSFFRGSESEEDYRSTWTPSVDIKETASEIVMVAELPGMTKNDVRLSVRDNTLEISGEKKQSEESKDSTFHRVERVYGKFYRSFSLPTTIDAAKIKAVFKDGILTMTLPKMAQAKPKQIEIKAE